MTNKQVNIVELAKEAGLTQTHSCCGVPDKFCTLDMWQGDLKAFAALVAAHEREACAKVCEDRGPKEGSMKLISDGFAAAIRVRGEK